jgi:hypothetical protein
MALARLDDLIVVAPTPADLEPLIDTAEGNIQPLADFGPYDDVKAEFDQDFLLFGFFNGVAAAEVQRQLGGVGLSSTAIGTTDRYTGLLIYADDLGFRFETVMMAAAGKSLSPASANFDSELAARTPDDVLLYLNASDLGRTGALDAAGAAVISVALGQAGDAGPTAGQTPEDYIAGIYEQSAQVLGVNLQTDLFQQMVGEYALWFSAGSGGDVNMLLVSEVEDPGVVTNALAQLTLLIQGAAGGTASITTRQIGGNQLSVIDSGDGAPAEYGVVDGNFFVFGVGTAIDDFVDGPVDTLADNEQFQEVMDALPSDVNGMVYIDLAQIIPLIESGAATASGSDGSDETTIEDASPDCANYDTQEEAQDAYDAGEEGTFDLDQDFDGTVCEDFFDTGVGAADVPATDEASSFQTDLSGILAFGLVAYDEGGVRHTSSILLIEG